MSAANRVRSLALSAALVLAACGAVEPSATPVARPTTPASWATFTSAAGDLRISLPPWIRPFDEGFANEGPASPGAPFIQLTYGGPASTEQQPGPGQDLRAWLQERLGRAPAPVTARSVLLPAGPAIELTRIDPAPNPWRVLAYAIRTPSGIGVLIIDGPADRFADREAELALIPWLIELGPGR